MQYQKLYLLALSFLLVLSTAVAAQEQAKPKRPVKNPPQYPHIIDLEGQQPQPAQPQKPEAVVTLAPVVTAPPPDQFVRVVEALAGEMRTLAQELRALNLRQQAQLDITRLTRFDLRMDNLERDLRPVRDRLAVLEVEDQNLQQMMSREGLLAQTAVMPSLNRDETMRQLKAQHELRQRVVRAEKERLQLYEADLTKQLNALRASSQEAEQRLKTAEETLRRDAVPPQ